MMKRAYEEDIGAMELDGSSIDNDFPNDALPSNWADFMNGKEYEYRLQAIQLLRKFFVKGENEEANWSTFAQDNKVDYLLGRAYRSQPPLQVEVTDLEIAVRNFEAERETNGADDDMAVSSSQAESSSAASSMPDLVEQTDNNAPKELLIKEIEEVEEKKEHIAPFLVLVQSSGYGKTKTALEVAKSRRVVYLLCSSINGGWQRPTIMDRFVQTIKLATDNTKRDAIALGFLQAVVLTAQKYSTPKALFESQITKEGALSTFYDDLERNWGADASVAAVSKLEDQTTNSSQRLVVVFDEATTLATEEDQGETLRSPYRAIVRNLKESNVIGLFLDTFGSVDLFLPEGAASDRTDTGIGSFQLPIFEIDTFDQFTDHVLFLGRPLWKMNWKYRHNKDYTKLVKFAAHKLYEPNSYPNYGLIALFLCRFGMHPTGALARRLVKAHMATLFGVSKDRTTLLAKYKSEPILAEASAYITAYISYVKPADVLSAMLVQIHDKRLSFPKGDGTEIAAAAWFGYTLDSIRKEDGAYDAQATSLSREVGVLELVRALCPPSYVVEEEVSSLLEEWTVNVTHFCSLGYSPSRSILEGAWKRHVGIYLPAGEEGVDILIPTFSKANETFSSIRVQVKNYYHRISEASKDNLFEKLDVRRCAPVCKFEDEPLSIAFLVQVGSGIMESGVRVKHLGRQQRNTVSAFQQVQIACSLCDVGNPELTDPLQEIAGDPIEQTEFEVASERFRDGELFEGERDQ